MSYLHTIAECMSIYNDSYREMMRICKQSSPKIYGEHLARTRYSHKKKGKGKRKW